MAHRGGRVIDTNTLRIFLVLHVPSDGQEREQGSEDNPDVHAHQRSLAAALPLANLASRQYTRNNFDRLYVASDRKSSIGSRVAPRNFDPPYDRCGSKLGRAGDVRCTTALPPKADVHPRSCYVAFVPISDICSAANCTLFNHLVGGGEQRLRHVETQRLCGLEIDRQFELGWLHHR